jgi:hypothetical protein
MERRMKSIRIFTLCTVLVIGLQAGEYQVGDHELLLMPTAYTMEAGQSYFSDYELVFLNYTYGVTPNTHVGVFTLFPITGDFLETLTLGVKQKYLSGEVVTSALWLTYTPKGSGLTIGNVFSFGKPSHGFHLGLATASSFENKTDEWPLIIMLGYRVDISKKLSFLAEYTNVKALIEEGFNGLISFGIRFRSESISWELGAIRPLQNTGDFLFAPLLKATFLIE